jgi:hypothetical protein
MELDVLQDLVFRARFEPRWARLHSRVVFAGITAMSHFTPPTNCGYAVVDFKEPGKECPK